MALIKCDECKKEFSNNAEVCPHCGNPQEATFNLEKLFTEKKSPMVNFKFFFAYPFLMIIIFALSGMVFNKMSNGMFIIMVFTAIGSFPYYYLKETKGFWIKLWVWGLWVSIIGFLLYSFVDQKIYKLF